MALTKLGKGALLSVMRCRGPTSLSCDGVRHKRVLDEAANKEPKGREEGGKKRRNPARVRGLTVAGQWAAGAATSGRLGANKYVVVGWVRGGLGA